jgi:hypothetical protein
MAWDSFSWKGGAALDFLDKGEMMNSARYLTILDEKLELFTRQDRQHTSCRMAHPATHRNQSLVK